MHMDIKFKETTVKIVDKISWATLCQIFNEQGKQNMGNMMTETIVGCCVSPKFTYAQVNKMEGFDVAALYNKIAKALGLLKQLEEYAKTVEDLKPEEDE